MNSEATWRVGHQGRDQMYYEEQHNGQWQRIDIDGEMLTGRAHHVIYFASPDVWQRYPEWARHRRDEIIARIKREFREPEYEYYASGSGVEPAPLTAPASPRPQASTAHRTPPSATPQQLRALLIAIGLVFAISATMAWLIVSGLTVGSSYLPIKGAAHNRVVTRVEDPVMYWTVISLYAIVGCATLGLGLWGTREGLKLKRGR